MTEAALAQLDRCNKCGFCLPTCPTYIRLELEPASPRGRIAIAEEVAAGRQALDPYVAEQMYLCLGCRACESACPSGVEYGVVLQDMRNQLDRAGIAPPGHEGLPTVLLEQVLTFPSRLRWLRRLFRFYQRSGLQARVRRTGILRRLSPGLARVEAGLPAAGGASAAPGMPAAGGSARADAHGNPTGPGGHAGEAPPAARSSRASAHGNWAVPAGVAGDGRADAAFFRGCIMDVVYAGTNDNAIRALERLGLRVTGAGDEVCCGALHAHAGRLDEARELARRNIAAFEATGAEVYVNAAGGCGAFLKEYGALLAGDPEWAARAALFSERMRDFSVAVVESPGWAELAPSLAPAGGDRRVTYQDSCHLRHGQKVARPPRQILQAVAGAGYLELPGADTCCGSAGIYSFTHRAMSSRVLADKMESVAEVAPDVLIAVNPGCQMQMQGGVAQAGLGDRVQVMHLADLLEAALARVVDLP